MTDDAHDAYRPLQPLDHPLPAVFVTVVSFVLGWLADVAVCFALPAPYDTLVVTLAFPGLVQLLWMAPIVAWAHLRGMPRFVRVAAVTAGLLLVANGVGLALVARWLPPGPLF